MTRAAELVERLDALYAEKTIGYERSGFDIFIYDAWPEIRALLAAAPPEGPNMDKLAAIRKAAESVAGKVDERFAYGYVHLDAHTILLMCAVCEAAQRLEAKYYSGNPPHDPGCPECDVRRAVRALGETHEPR